MKSAGWNHEGKNAMKMFWRFSPIALAIVIGAPIPFHSGVGVIRGKDDLPHGGAADVAITLWIMEDVFCRADVVLWRAFKVESPYIYLYNELKAIVEAPDAMRGIQKNSKRA